MYVKALSLMPKLKCLVSFFQILTVLPTIYSVSMPRFYTDWMSAFNWVNLDIISFVVPLKCVTGSNVTALTLKAFVPLGLIAAWFLIVLLTLAYRKVRSSSLGRLGLVAETEPSSSPALASSSKGSGRLEVTSISFATASRRLSRESISFATASNSMPLGSLLYSTVLSALPLSLGLLFCFFPSVSSDVRAQPP